MNHGFPPWYVSPGYRPIPSEAYVNAFSICRELLRIRGSSGSRTLNGYVRPRLLVLLERYWGSRVSGIRRSCCPNSGGELEFGGSLFSFAIGQVGTSYPRF